MYIHTYIPKRSVCDYNTLIEQITNTLLSHAIEEAFLHEDKNMHERFFNTLFIYIVRVLNMVGVQEYRISYFE